MNARLWFALTVGGAAVAIALAVGLARQVGVKSYGRPVGRVVRTGEHLAVLMETREPYFPSLQGRKESDMSYSYALWLIPASGDGDARVVRLNRGVRSTDRSQFAGVLGSVGNVVWLRISDLVGVDSASASIVTTTPPPSIANMPISEFLGPNHSPTLRPYRTTGVTLPSGEWLVLADEEEAKTELRPGTTLYDNSTSKGTYRDRALYAVTTQAGPIPRLAASTQLPGVNLHNAAFMRGKADGEVIRFSNPDGFLLVYEGGGAAVRTIHFARVNVDGAIAWTVDTRMGHLAEVLSHQQWPAFVGELENQLSEPMLAVLDLKAGTIKHHSLKGPLQ